MISRFFTVLPVRNAALTLLSSSALLLAGSGFALAQNKPAVPSDVPPTLERLEEGGQPDITIRKPSAPENGQVDTRDPSGAVTETEVKSGGSTYYVRPNRQVGNAQPGDLQSSGNRAAQFKIGEFGLGRNKAPVKELTPPEAEPAPLPPALPARN